MRFTGFEVHFCLEGMVSPLLWASLHTRLFSMVGFWVWLLGFLPNFPAGWPGLEVVEGPLTFSWNVVRTSSSLEFWKEVHSGVLTMEGPWLIHASSHTWNIIVDRTYLIHECHVCLLLWWRPWQNFSGEDLKKTTQKTTKFKFSLCVLQILV